MNEAQRRKVLEILRAQKAAAKRAGEIQSRLEILLTTPEVIEYTSLTAELESYKKTLTKDNPVRVARCKHPVVLCNGYKERGGLLLPNEELDPYTEEAIYCCLDCGNKITVPVREGWNDFEEKREVIGGFSQSFSGEQIEALLNYYRSLLESHSAKETIRLFRDTYIESLNETKTI